MTAREAVDPEDASALVLLWTRAPLSIGVGERTVLLKAGDLALLEHRSAVAQDLAESRDTSLLKVDPAYLCTPKRRLARSIGQPIDGTTPLAEAVKAAWAIGNDLRSRGDCDDLIEDHLLRLLGGLIRRLLRDHVDPRLSEHSAAMLERADLIIARDLGSVDFGPAALAAEMRISTRHLSSLFAAIGTTTSAAIASARMARAKALLSDPADRKRQIASIARDCGFRDQGYFARRFQTLFGETPRAFRDRTNL